VNILKRIQTLIPAVALAAVLALLGSANLYAQKKPGGGGSGGETTPVPAGTIHFSQSTADPSYYAEMTMKADGSAKAQIGLSEQGNWLEPSYQLHGGQRWFLNMRDTGVMNEYDVMIQELFVVAEEDLVQVTDDPGLYWVDNVRWAQDDSFLSFVGFSYDSTNDEYEDDLYVADVDWNVGSPVIGTPRKVLSRGAELGAYDWSPAGDELVYENYISGDNEIRVARPPRLVFQSVGVKATSDNSTNSRTAGCV
jgi:hypothetical protein